MIINRVDIRDGGRCSGVIGGLVEMCGVHPRCSSRDGAQPGLGLGGGFPAGSRLRMLRGRVLVLLSHEPALLQKPVDHYPVCGHYVAPRPPGSLFIEHGAGDAQPFQRPSGVRLGVGVLDRVGRRVSAPLAVHRVVVEPYLVLGRFLQPVGLEHPIDVEPLVG